MPPADEDGRGGQLLANLLKFGRMLRRLGFRVSTQQIVDLGEALAHVDLGRRDDAFHTMRATLVHDPEGFALFEQAFDLFWQGRLVWAVDLGAGRGRRKQDDLSDKLPADEEVIVRQQPGDPAPAEEPPEDAGEIGVTATYSAAERLHRKDFAEFDEEELEAARRFIHALVWRLDTRLTRRQVRAAKRDAYLDVRRAIRGSMRHGGEIVELAWRRRKPKPRPLVVLCDISGSMERYSRLFLHFLYALVQEGRHVEAFVFGTRLTRITPALRRGNVDAAVARAAEIVVDWSGGTRIGRSLRTFNYEWSRRVLGQGAVAIIISDGWDRGDIGLLETEVTRLSRSVSRLMWLNPLLGAPDYEPLVRGIQAALPYVDDFLPLHNLLSLEQLALELGSLRLERGRAIR
jgi:uncharacterized protein with von Willebrand factor type A (vWA) domain